MIVHYTMYNSVQYILVLSFQYVCNNSLKLYIKFYGEKIAYKIRFVIKAYVSL